MRVGAKHILALGLSLLSGGLGCSAEIGQEQGREPERPEADRELWDFRLDVHEPDLRVRISGRYGRDFLEEEVTLVDSGVEVSFESAAGALRSQLVAQRLRLDHRGDQVGFVGEVVARAGDSLAVETDSLVWERQEGMLWFPGHVRLRLQQGTETGRALRAQVDLSTWEMERVEGTWQGEGYDIGIRARHERGWRQGSSLQADYEAVEASWRQGRVEAAWAVFDGVQERVVFSGGVVSSDSNRVLRAGEVEVELKGKRVLARDGVVMEVDSLRLMAEELAEEEGGRWQAKGQPASIDHRGRTIAAQRLWGSSAEEIVHAAEDVVCQVDRLQLTAQRLSYDRANNQLEARGQVVMGLEDFDGEARGGRLRYQLDQERAILDETPQLERRRAGEESLYLGAQEMEFDLEKKLIVGRHQFALQGGRLAVEAEQGEYGYAQEVLHLVRHVVLRHWSGEEKRRQLEADSMVVRFEAGQLRLVEMPAGVKGTVNDANVASWLQAKSGQLHWSGEALQRVELNGEAEVIQQTLADSGVSRFSGEALVIFFDTAGQLTRMTATGKAQLDSRMQEEDSDGQPSLNRVAGERLEVLLTEGAIDTVQVLDKIEGTYFPADSESDQ